mmetsp:Transcript_29276/g.46434  ORF Transcript_29276/g.46434 Transcript_29276/m.46434 type:complete len:208 (-) Transcript_29276:266-889(-)
MGGFITKAIQKISGQQQRRILMVGLDSAGKTTILYKLKLGEVVTTIPTIGFIVETVTYKNIEFTVWDMGGRGNFRKTLWRHYYPSTSGIIFVLDCNDKERIGHLPVSENDPANKDIGYFYDDTAAEELYAFVQDEALKGVPLLVLANKQDLPDAMSGDSITDHLGLKHKYHNRAWHVQPCCAKTGDGLYDGLDWLWATLKNQKKMKK